jgi:hypothetical protein
VRRLVPLCLAALVAVAGCGTERPASVREAGASFSPAPSPSETPTPSVTPPPTRPPTNPPKPSPTALRGPLADFPLAIGLPDRNGDDQSPVVVRGVPATKAFGECGRRVWDPHDGTTDVIGVEWSAEAEWSRGRTLVLFPSSEAATAAVDTARDVITSCPRDDGNDDGWTEHTPVDYFQGDQSVGWIDRWWASDVGGFGTGLVVYHVARVGRAVLFTYEYGEGNGSEQTRLAAVARAAKADQYVVDAMADRF